MPYSLPTSGLPRRPLPATVRLTIVCLLFGAVGGAALIPAAAGGVAPTQAPPIYAVHDFGLGEIRAVTDVNASNVGSGSITVEGSGDEPVVHAALFKEGQAIDLGTLGGMWSSASALSDNGQVVGWSTTASGAGHVFLWSDANEDGVANPGEMRDLGVGIGKYVNLVDINNRGEIVGHTILGDSNRAKTRALRCKNGKWSLLGRSGATEGRADWIGDDGTILGATWKENNNWGSSTPTRWRPGRAGEAIPIPRFKGFSAYVAGRTRSGDIWMTMTGDYDSRVCVLRKGKLVPRKEYGSAYGRVIAVNRDGVAVGRSGNSIAQDWNRGRLWYGKAAYDLNDLLIPGSGLIIQSATRINDSGWIVADATTGEGEPVPSVLLEPRTRE